MCRMDTLFYGKFAQISGVTDAFRGTPGAAPGTRPVNSQRSVVFRGLALQLRQ